MNIKNLYKICLLTTVCTLNVMAADDASHAAAAAGGAGAPTTASPMSEAPKAKYAFEKYVNDGHIPPYPLPFSVLTRKEAARVAIINEMMGYRDPMNHMHSPAEVIAAATAAGGYTDEVARPDQRALVGGDMITIDVLKKTWVPLTMADIDRDDTPYKNFNDFIGESYNLSFMSLSNIVDFKHGLLRRYTTHPACFPRDSDHVDHICNITRTLLENDNGDIDLADLTYLLSLRSAIDLIKIKNNIVVSKAVLMSMGHTLSKEAVRMIITDSTAEME